MHMYTYIQTYTYKHNKYIYIYIYYICTQIYTCFFTYNYTHTVQRCTYMHRYCNVYTFTKICNLAHPYIYIHTRIHDCTYIDMKTYLQSYTCMHSTNIYMYIEIYHICQHTYRYK